MKTIKEITGYNLKRIRESAKMTQEVLAGRIYSQAPTISAMERGERPITHKTLEVLCDVFAVLPEEFYKIDHNGKDDLDKMLAEEIEKMGRQCKAELYAKAVAINTQRGRGEQWEI